MHKPMMLYTVHLDLVVRVNYAHRTGSLHESRTIKLVLAAESEEHARAVAIGWIDECDANHSLRQSLFGSHTTDVGHVALAPGAGLGKEVIRVKFVPSGVLPLVVAS